MHNRPLRDLTEEEILRYEEDGVIHVRGLFDKDWAQLVRAACEENLVNPSPRVREAVKPGASRAVFIVMCGRAITTKSFTNTCSSHPVRKLPRKPCVPIRPTFSTISRL
jgi:hypothetical protein